MIDAEETKRNKAKQLRYKKPIVKNLNLDFIQQDLWDIQSECEDVRWYTDSEDGEDSLINALDSNGSHGPEVGRVSTQDGGRKQKGEKATIKSEGAGRPEDYDDVSDPTGRREQRKFGIWTEAWRPGGEDWWETEPNVGRVANGVPNRVDRIRCLGNAVVPQQFYPIFQAIAEIERREEDELQMRETNR